MPNCTSWLIVLDKFFILKVVLTKSHNGVLYAVHSQYPMGVQGMAMYLLKLVDICAPIIYNRQSPAEP